MRKHGYVAHLALTAVVGLVFWGIGELFYPVLTKLIWPPIVVALYFALFGGAMYGVMFLLCKARNDYKGWADKNLLDVVSAAFKHAAIALLVVVFASGVFEFLYELNFNAISTKASSYVFMIDYSDSMDWNDPNNVRIDAISEIMSEEDDDMPYAVYSFSHETYLIKDMAVYTDADTFPTDNNGGTDIVGALNTVVDDIEAGTLNVGNAPKILLLSDGDSYSDGLQNVINKCNKNNIVVSTIGLNSTSSLLHEIAEGTGGTFTEVNDVALLRDEMQTAITTSSNRTLLSDRYVMNNNLIYGIMRVVMLILLGLGWSWMKQKAYCCAFDHSFADKVFLVSAILTTVAAISVELLFSFTPLHAFVIRFIFCILFAATPGVFWSGAFNVQGSDAYGVGLSNQGTFGNYGKRGF